MKSYRPACDPLKKLQTALLVVAAGMILTACRRQGGVPPASTPEVAVVEMTEKTVQLTMELPGRTAPYLIAEIRPQVNGLIQKRLFTEGADVRVGQELYQIDPAPFQAVLDNAKASLSRAEANLPAIRSRVERYKEALNDKAVSQQDFDDAEALFKQALSEIEYSRATMETARINLNYARIVSPISGRIGKSSVTDGAIVTAYQPVALATVQQLDPIYVDVPQSTTELLRLQRRLNQAGWGQGNTNASKVRLILEDGSPYPLEGTLQFRDVSVDPTTASVILRMVFRNPNGVLLPGMFVRVVLQEGTHSKAILIPQQSVSRDPKGNPLTLVVDNNGKVSQRTLELDRAIGDQWLVNSGLAAGDKVVVEGMQKVRPGAVARVSLFVDSATNSAGVNPPSTSKNN